MSPSRAVGRGRNYSRRRAVLEKLARLVYGGGWPGRAWGLLPGRREVDLLRHELALLPPSVVPVAVPMTPTAAGPTASGWVLRVAFVSDLHLGPLTSPALLDRAFALLTALRPDVLLLGGDYVYLEATEAVARELEARVAAVPAPVKLAVLGNHDLWTDHPRLERALGRAGARVLVNDAARLPPPFDDVAVVGLDDPWSGAPDAARAVAAAGDAPLLLGLAHSPEAVPHLRGHPVRLLVCGHTHGGQMALPSGPLIVHGKHGRLWPSGLHGLGDLQLFVSRGVGAVELPFRVGARPDVALFTLRERGSAAP